MPGSLHLLGVQVITVPTWRKSTHSNPAGSCVELAYLDSVRGIRDSKLGDKSPVLRIRPTGLKTFIDGLKV